MDIRKAAIYCRGDNTEFQAGVGIAFIIDKGLSYYGLFSDEPDDEEPNESLLKLIEHCRYDDLDVIIMRNYEVIEDAAVKRLLNRARITIPIIGVEDLYCTDENLNLETLKYEKKHRVSKNLATLANGHSTSDNKVVREAFRRVYESRRWSGYISGVVPYGFKRTDGKLIPDPVTAPVVRTIFDKALEGERITAIAAWLSRQGIVSPSDEKTSAGNTVVEVEPEVALIDRATGDVVKTMIPTPVSRWSDNTIRDMLRNEVYTLGIIDRELFDKVQERFNSSKTEITKRNRGLYQGLVRCGSCHRAMTYQGTDVNGRKKATYFCKFHTGSNPKSEPLGHMPKVDEEVLKEEVLRQCNDYIEGFTYEKLASALEQLSRQEQAAEERIFDLGEKLIKHGVVAGKKYKGLWTSWEHTRRRRMMAIAYSALLSHRFNVYQFGQMDENDLDTELKLMKSITVDPDGKVVVNFLGDDVLGV